MEIPAQAQRLEKNALIQGKTFCSAHRIYSGAEQVTSLLGVPASALAA